MPRLSIVKDTANSLGFTPIAKSSYLESISPTDSRFDEATKSDESVFPSTKDARDSLVALKQQADKAAKEGDFVKAQSLVEPYRLKKLELEADDLMFELVRECEKDAGAAKNMEFEAMEYAKAGEWDLLHTLLVARLRDYRDQQEDAVRAAKRARVVSINE